MHVEGQQNMFGGRQRGEQIAPMLRSRSDLGAMISDDLVGRGAAPGVDGREYTKVLAEVGKADAKRLHGVFHMACQVDIFADALRPLMDGLLVLIRLPVTCFLKNSVFGGFLESRTYWRVKRANDRRIDVRNDVHVMGTLIVAIFHVCITFEA